MPMLDQIVDKSQWEGFLLSGSVVSPSFFQSWNWGDVQKALGHNIYRFGLFDEKKLVGICLAVEIKARRGHYLHLRHGPVLVDLDRYFDLFHRGIVDFAREMHVDFIRMSPSVDSSFGPTLFAKYGFRNAPIHNMDAENAWVLDIDIPDDKLLSGMRKTTRYLIRKAQQLPISIEATTNVKAYEKFIKLYEITSARHGFVPHRGMKEELEIFGKDNEALIFLATYKNVVIAGAIIIFYGNQAIYHHAATDDAYRDIPAAYLLQWEIIKEAKKRGKTLYNFWGVVPENKKKHPWQGLTLFKTGFGGRRVNSIHAQDLPLNVSYAKSFFIETVWRIKRGY